MSSDILEIGPLDLSQGDVDGEAPLVVGVAGGNEPGDVPRLAGDGLPHRIVFAGQGGKRLVHRSLNLVWAVALIEHQRIALGQGGLLSLTNMFGHGVKDRHHKFVAP